MSHLDHAFLMSEHKGACNALIAACRLLNLADKWDASELLMKHIEQLVPQVPVRDLAPEPLPALPKTWPFPKDAEEALL